MANFFDWARNKAPRARTPVAVATVGADQVPGGDWLEQHYRAYANADFSRLTSGWYYASTSADTELAHSLRDLRARSRSLIRDNAYAKRARTHIVNNVIGQGIDIQAQVKGPNGRFLTAINSEIEDKWHEWEQARNCHIANVLHYRDLERLIMAEIVEAGEMFVRIHAMPTPCGVPMTLELIEPERLAEEYETPSVGLTSVVRMGVELDQYHRPMGFYVKTYHPGEIRREAASIEQLIRVPAQEMAHLCPISRWPQTRGEPWFHAVAKRLWNIDGYTDAELVAMRASANYMGLIQSPIDDMAPAEQVPLEGQDENALAATEFLGEPGTIKKLAPGETFTEWSPNRPNNGAEPFLRFMLREVASGLNMRYASISGDYSQANYSSERASMLEERDQWRVLQFWFLRAFRERIHREFVSRAVMARALKKIGVDQYALAPIKYQAARYKLRGWGWIDPTKEVAAYKEAIAAGITDLGTVIANTAQGDDLEDVMARIESERELMKEKGLTFDWMQQAQPAPVRATPEVEKDDLDEEGGARRGRLNKVKG